MRCGPFHLQSIELGIEPTTCYQVVVCSFLEDHTILEHNDFIGAAQRAEAMRGSRMEPSAEHHRGHSTAAVLPLPLGSVNWKVAPLASLAITRNFPPWASMIERLIANPIPIPCGLVV